MTEQNMRDELNRDQLIPVRLHLVSGKTIDVNRQGVAWPLSNRLLIFINAADRGVRAENYDIIPYQNIERIQPLGAEKRNVGKRRGG